MAAKCASPAPPLGEKHIFENQTVKLGWHVLTFAGSFWSRTDCRYEDRQWIDWMTPILKNGGAVTIDLAIDRPTGRLNDAQAAQLKRVFKACRSW